MEFYWPSLISYIIHFHHMLYITQHNLKIYTVCSIIAWSFPQNQIGILYLTHIWCLWWVQGIIWSQFCITSEVAFGKTSHIKLCEYDIKNKPPHSYHDTVNSLRPGDTYLHHWTGSSLDQIWLIACSELSHCLNHIDILSIRPWGTYFNVIFVIL